MFFRCVFLKTILQYIGLSWETLDVLMFLKFPVFLDVLKGFQKICFFWVLDLSQVYWWFLGCTCVCLGFLKMVTFSFAVVQ